jgi:hypothetical protein
MLFMTDSFLIFFSLNLKLCSDLDPPVKGTLIEKKFPRKSKYFLHVKYP